MDSFEKVMDPLITQSAEELLERHVGLCRRCQNQLPCIIGDNLRDIIEEPVPKNIGTECYRNGFLMGVRESQAREKP